MLTLPPPPFRREFANYSRTTLIIFGAYRKL